MADQPRGFHEKDVALSNGLKIHYYEWPGPGLNLVLLHPSSGYGRMWEWTVNGLGPRLHVYALDQRGHGDSGRPDGDYSAEEYAHDLYLFFREVGLDRAIIAGQSLGGRVGQVFAATRLADQVQSDGAYARGVDPDVEALYKQQARELDRKKREAMLHQIQQILYDRVRFGPLYEFIWPSAIGPRVAEPALLLIDPYPWSAPYEDVRLKEK